jgi:hypothetical protein
MSEGDIQVILAELKNIKDDMAEIKVDIKERCKNCLNTAVMEERVGNQWRHIASLWAVIVFLCGTVGGTVLNRLMGR